MAKPDEGVKLTEQELNALEKRIAAVYRQAAKELDAEVKAYFVGFEMRDAEQKSRVDAGEITEQQYRQWRLNQIARGKHFEALRDKMAQRYTQANETSVAYVNDATPGIYSLNRNYAAYTIEQVSDKADFTLWDERTVRRMITEQPDSMPYYPPERAVRRGIDLSYGKRQITASVTSAILQGKSIGQIADDLQQRIQTMNRNSAIRSARTAVTGAQNAGRLDSYAAAEKMGIKLKKQWLATLDGRTRHSHALLDGESVDRKKPFSNGCMFPGDPNGKPEEVYNCRCTLVADLDGIDQTSERRAKDPKTGETVLVRDMTYAQWAGWKQETGAFMGLSLQPQTVTMESISRVKAFSCETLDAAGQERLKNMHKQLLLIARKQEPGIEVGRAFSLNMESLTGYIVGQEPSHVYIPDQNVPYVAIHTHPSSSTFSPGDLFRFAKRDNLKMLTAIGHDGHIYAIEKTAAFDSKRFISRISYIQAETTKITEGNTSDRQKLEEMDSFIREELQKISDYGVIYYE